MNPDKIYWNLLCLNPAIIEPVQVWAKEKMKNTIAEDLMKNRFHPKYMDVWDSWGYDDMDLS